MWVQVPPPSLSYFLFTMQFFIQNKSVFRELLTVLPAGAATTGPPLGPLLGQFGVNTPSFCKQFNEATSVFSSTIKNKLVLLSVKIIIYDDKTLGFIVYKPHTSFLIKQLRKKVSSLNSSFYTLALSDLFKIVQFKFGLIKNSNELLKLSRIVLGTALSMQTIVVN
jgi:large subunit ribosomal protein L11|uniref:Ribosomal protein L11 n=1 Tax=Vermamoeba vermiformis TaxID=5778 RepID=D4PBI5_VERVE|nr:ribosomal protein L11 [Vermamoeba vermiformis]ADD62197.1 ribosomal protein L11 [Vermamoeba vermiformis]